MAHAARQPFGGQLSEFQHLRHGGSPSNLRFVEERVVPRDHPIGHQRKSLPQGFRLFVNRIQGRLRMRSGSEWVISPAVRKSPPWRTDTPVMATTALQTGLQIYLRQINDSPLLSAEEEKSLARRLEQGDFEARERMVRSNLRLVVNIAKHYMHRGLSLQDLIEEGNIGLIKAVEGFDPDMGCRFSTYASWWIKQGIKRSLINAVQPIHIPAYMVEMMTKLKIAMRELENRLGRQPMVEELSAHMKVSPKKVRIIRKAAKAFNAPTQSGSDDGEVTIENMVADENNPSPDQIVLNNDERLKLGELLEDIDEREANILKLRYGLSGEDPLTLKEIGVRIGLTRERVRQLEHLALKKLREAMGN
jgi:RNA polymerase primary sigma factor